MPVVRNTTLFQWATESTLCGTASVTALTRDGWQIVAAHPWYPETWLLERTPDEEEEDQDADFEPLDDEVAGWPDPDAGDHDDIEEWISRART